MNILVIEDEELVAKSLIKLLKEVAPGANILGPLESVKSSIQWLSTHPAPDLIISDIQLSDGVSLDIFTREQQCPVIFTTAYNEYAIRAFKINSIDYLLKPVDKKELTAAFEKFYLLQEKYNNRQYLQEMKSLFQNFTGGIHHKERFAVHFGKKVMLVPLSEVALFVKEELIYLVNKEGRKYITDYRSLDEVEELVDPKVFFRANRQHLVHLPFIESYHTEEGGKLVLTLKGYATQEATINKDKAAAFRQWFDA
jgi:DNA-binding LytR/AlgR family response regulator